MSVDVVVAVPAFLDMTFVGLEALPRLGEERFAGDLVRSPGGGAITAIGAARLGLDVALASPIADDPAGEMIREEMEAEGVRVVGTPCTRTPVTMVLPLDGQRAMVTYDPGARARAADVAALAPTAVVTGLSQLDVVPAGARAYVSVGDDDARAFAGRLPSDLERAAGLLIESREGMVLTGADTPEAAAEVLGRTVPAAIVGVGERGAVAVVEGRRVDIEGYQVGGVVDPTGTNDLFIAAWVWGVSKGLAIEDALHWGSLYAALSVRVPTGARGATPLGDFIEEGSRRGLQLPPEN
jgi:ribokinase